MLFTVDQYDQAIEDLTLAKNQHTNKTTSEGCSICGGCCHPDLCGRNPLYAMHLCEEICKGSEALHEALHYMSGVQTYMGERTGPARVIKPEEL